MPVRREAADVSLVRERQRLSRLRKVIAILGLPAGFLWWRILENQPINFFQLPHIDPIYLLPAVIVLLIAATLAMQASMMRTQGKSPHTMFRPEQIGVSLDDVVGIDVVKDEVARSLQLFLSHETFASEMGGRARRGILFEGGPGTGKTYTAKAMAAEAGVPFLFATGTSFTSSLQGASQRRVRQYFKALRKAARAEGGAIGFIDEFDAMGYARSGIAAAAVPAASARSSMTMCCGGLVGLPSVDLRVGTAVQTMPFQAGGDAGQIVNELLVQMQSFDEPTGWEKFKGTLADRINLLLPAYAHITRHNKPTPNILLIASTNRADKLDPALMRPGRFDARLTFELPDKRGRRALIDHFLVKKSHDADVADAKHRDALAALTQGYSPAMLEGLMDEALINAVREDRREMSWKDLERARLVTEVGLAQPVAYTAYEAGLIATHEAGHTTVAWLVAPERRLEVVTIIKRRDALGMLAHGDREEVYTRSRSEMTALIQIAMGGQVAEELFFDNDVSTGPGGDLSYATAIAAQMVGAVGMGDSLVSYLAVENSSFSDTNIVGRVLGDPAGRQRVEKLLHDQKAMVRSLLGRHRHLVAALRDALLERHELIGEEITEVLDAAAAAYGPVYGTDDSPVVLDLTALELHPR